MELFLRYKTLIFRIVGVFLILFSIVLQFWDNSKELSENEKAAIRVARMEASVKTHSTTISSKPDTSKFVKNIEKAQEKQAQYITIFSSVFGIVSLLYSFLANREERHS